MASIQEIRLAEIAAAIRTKEGSTGPIPANTFAERILALPAGGGLPDDVYTISVTADPPEGGTVTGGGVASEGMTVTVNAKEASGYSFNGWKENGEAIHDEGKLYTFTANKNRALTAAFVDSGFPGGYTQVQYIQTPTSDCGFDTGVKVNMKTTGLVMDFAADAYTASGRIFYENGTSNPRFKLWRSSDTQVSKQLGNASKGTAVTVKTTGVRLKISYLDGVLKIGNTSLELITLTTSTENNVYLFSSSSGGSCINGRLYSAKMYENEELIRDWVPCISPAGVVGLYDLVERKFYENAWGGTVTAGPAV